MSECAIAGCGAAAEAESPVALCTAHLLAAYDHVARDVGVTDVLEQACLEPRQIRRLVLFVLRVVAAAL